MPEDYTKLLDQNIKYLSSKKKVLILTTSTRWSGSNEKAKSTQIGEIIQNQLGSRCEVINVSELKIHPCEGNVSGKDGNSCGVIGSKLNDKSKNPSGNHRCWASINNQDDELWKISKSLLESDFVLFLGSVRWGQMNAIYQNLIERLTWLENRHSTLEEENVLEKIECGLIITAHNWNAENVIKTQKKVLQYFGFRLVEPLCWYWIYTEDPSTESLDSYRKAIVKFKRDFKSL